MTSGPSEKGRMCRSWALIDKHPDAAALRNQATAFPYVIYSMGAQVCEVGLQGGY